MLTLYVETGCGFCAKVLKKVEELGLKVEEKNIADDGVSEELEIRGGQVQVPYLVDEVNDVEMYESDAIVEYLDEKYGGKEE